MEFMTDAPKVELLMTSTSIQVEVDDQPIGTSLIALPAGGGEKRALLDFTAVGGSKVRKIRVELMAAVALSQVRVGPTYNVWAPSDADELRVAVVGDSIISSTGAAMPNGGWTSVAGKLLGWTDVRQVAFGGSGFIATGGQNTIGSAGRVADVVAHDPDLVVICTSGNDATTGLTAAALAALQAYRAALPTVPIVVTGVSASSTGPSAGELAKEAAVLAAFTSWVDGNSYWIPVSNDPAGSWETGTGTAASPTGAGNRDRFGADTAHPNDLGHAYIGRRFADAFRARVAGLL
jgi:lysophospholipase L1-like esterase